MVATCEGCKRPITIGKIICVMDKSYIPRIAGTNELPKGLFKYYHEKCLMKGGKK